MSSIWAKGCLLMIVCVLSDLTCLPLLGGGRTSWYIIITMSGRIGKVVSSHAKGCKIESRLWLSCTDLHYARGTQGVLPMRVWSATSQLDLPSVAPLSAVGCGRLQLGVPNWATSVDYCKQLIIDPTFCGSRFSTRRLLPLEDFTFLPSIYVKTLHGYRQFTSNPYIINICCIAFRSTVSSFFSKSMNA